MAGQAMPGPDDPVAGLGFAHAARLQFDEILEQLVSFPVPAGRRVCGKIGVVTRPRRAMLAQARPLVSLTLGAASGAAHCCHEHEGPPLLVPVGSCG